VTDWIGAAEAAQRLGIKPASLYSYVSRGVLTPRRGPDGRASLFDAAEGFVDGGRHAYRAKFSGLTQTAAREACSTVKTHGIPCVTGERA